jgi:methylenetetrahydrofolate--tRNA-(uracil-5-)-methyltransferase
LPAVIATGPLTDQSLSDALQTHLSSEHLYFYDAIAPSIDADSIDSEKMFWASRYGKGQPDYVNIPLSKETYESLIDFIVDAELTGMHLFEESRYFEACLPIEVMAKRGRDTLRHGPLKPKGLIDPSTGKEPYAVIQMRKENKNGTLLGLVGMQTRMKHPQQNILIKKIPGLENAKILRYGSIHKNTFMNLPAVCETYQQDRIRKGLYYAGQICGVEGYCECILSGLVAAMTIAANLLRKEMPELPETTMCGALMRYIHTPAKNFQPMNANMGLLPAIPGPKKPRRIRNQALSERALNAMRQYRETHHWLFDPFPA